jgi:hypothetical protein
MTIGRIPSVEGGIQPTIFDAAGDLLYASAADTPARLAIGTAGQVLKVNSGATAPEWGAASSGGMTLISTTTFSSTAVELTSIPSTYVNLMALVTGVTTSGNNDQFTVQLNSDTANHYFTYSNTTTANAMAQNTSLYLTPGQKTAGNSNNSWAINVYNYAQASAYKPFAVAGHYYSTGGAGLYGYYASGGYNSTTAISSLKFYFAGATFTAGTVYLYGVK